MHYQRWRAHGSPDVKLTRKGMSLDDRFEEQVDRSSGPDGCHIWTGTLNKGGYGITSANGTNRGAHRVAWYLANGRWPDEDVLHSCDNPPCVNPVHLSDGTHAENMRQMVERGRRRSPVGEEHHAAKLTEDGLAEARALRDQGWTLKQLGERYGVHLSTIGRAVKGDKWQQSRGDYVPKIKRAGKPIEGERHGQAIISDAQVAEMRQLFAGGWTRKQLHERYGISKSQVQRIVTNTGRRRAA